MLNKLVDKALGDIEVAFLFGEVTFVVCLVQQQPLLRLVPQCVLQALKDQVAIVAAVAMGTQGRQRGRVRGIAGKVEAAFQRQDRLPRILQAHACRTEQARPLPFIRRFRLEFADARQVRQRQRGGKCHVPFL